MSERRARESSPRPRGANPELLKKAQAKYKKYTDVANMEYERLFEENRKKKLTPNNDPAQHAMFVHLTALREGDSQCKFD